jgi:hypothetical protein
MINLLNTKMGIVKAGTSFFDPAGADEVGIDSIRSGLRRLQGGTLSSIRLEEVARYSWPKGF